MSQYRKLKPSRCDVDQIIVAHKPEGDLSDPRGVLFRIKEIKGNVLKGVVLKSGKQVAIDLSKDDAWAYDPTSATTNIVINVADFNAFPGFTPRMQKEGWNGKEFEFKTEEVVFDDKPASPGNGMFFLRHTGETKKEDGTFYRNLFRMSDISLASPPEWRVSRAEAMGADVVELPLPPKPVLAENNAIIEAITPWLKTLNKALTSENTSHGKCSADFKQKQLYKNTVCHADLQRDVDFEVGYVFTIGKNRSGGRWVKGSCSEEAELLWITYLTSYSPYADAFITKDPAYILEHGYILRGDAPSRLVVGACFATRQIWEKPERADGFLELYKAGLSLDEAFLFGSQCSIYRGGKMKLGQDGSGHSHIYNGRLTDECISNFLDHVTVKDEPFNVNCKPSDSRGGVDGMWSNSFGKKPVSKLVTKLMGIKKQSGIDTSLPVEDCVELAVDAIREWRETL